VREALGRASDHEVLYLLGVMQQLGDVDWTPEFRALMSRDAAEVKVAALEYFERRGTAEDVAVVRPALVSPDARVRKAAVVTLARLAGAQATTDLVTLLNDDDVDVRAATTSELINVGDLDGLLGACVALKNML